LYADTQADSLENEPAALAAFDEWTRHFARHVESKGMVEGADEARSPRRNDYENRLMACQAGGGETQP
jgi:hypothetical protein